MLQRVGLSKSDALSESGAPHKAGVQIVPELDVVLVQFPAEENFMPVPQMRKIHQPAVHVLDDNAHLDQFLEPAIDMSEVPEHSVDYGSAEVAACFVQQVTEFLVGQMQPVAQAMDIGEHSPQQRNGRARLIHTEVP